MEKLFDVLHVVTAVFLVGPMAILPMTGLRAVRAGDADQTRRLAKSTWVISWLSLLVVVFGFGLLGMSDPKYDLSVTTPWILISLIVYLAALVLSLFLVVPRLRKAADGMTGGPGGGGGAAAAPSYSQLAALSGSVTSLLVVVVVLMVAKP